jgi:hypothetical protein
MGISSLLMPYGLSSNKSEYCLTNKTADQLCSQLQEIYGVDKIFVPGWLTKGCDMPLYTKDIIHLADTFWNDGVRAVFGMYLEQLYNQHELDDKFTPIYCVVPFLIKTNVDSAFINLTGPFDDSDKSLNALAQKQFNEEKRFELFKTITADIPQVVSIGPNAVLPGEAYLEYNMSMIKRAINQERIARY